MIYVMIAHANRVMLDGIMAELLQDEGLRVNSSTQNAYEVAALMQKGKADVVLVAEELPGCPEAVREIKKNYPVVKILLMTGNNNEEYALRLVSSKADGSILIDGEGGREILKAIHTVYREGKYFTAEIEDMIHEALRKAKFLDRHLINLTPREHEILRLIAQGLSGKEIAAPLSIKENTVKFHRKNLYEKFGVHTAMQMFKAAQKHLLI
ncbi:MAG: response regulator transcription factor [Chitinophagales bacterium]